VILMRRFLIVVVITLIAAGLAAAFSSAQKSHKVATASLVFGQPRPEIQVVSSGFSSGDQSSQFVPGTNASLVSADDIARATAGKLKVSPSEVRDSVKVSAQQSSEIVQVQASRPTAAEAAQFANTYVNVYVDRTRAAERGRALTVLRSLHAQLESARKVTTTRNSFGSKSAAAADQLRSQIAAETALARVGSGSPSVAQTASPSDTSTAPKTSRNVLFGALFGLVLGIGIAGLVGGRREGDDYDGGIGARNGSRERSPVGV
jgi:capsular polysaccharide biosynthesis protein